MIFQNIFSSRTYGQKDTRILLRVHKNTVGDRGLSILFRVHHNTLGRGGGVIHPILGTPQHSWERGRGYPSYSGYTTTQLREGEGLSILFRVHKNTVGRGGEGIHLIQGTPQHSWERGEGLSILFRVHHNTVGTRGRSYPSYSGYTTTHLGERVGTIRVWGKYSASLHEKSQQISINPHVVVIVKCSYIAWIYLYSLVAGLILCFVDLLVQSDTGLILYFVDLPVQSGHRIDLVFRSLPATVWTQDWSCVS